MSPIVRSGFAPAHRQRSRQSSHWRSVREQALARDGYRCQLNDVGCTGTATTIHLDARLDGDHLQAHLGNVVSCCRGCHSRRGGL